MLEITSKNNPKIKAALMLRQKKYRQEQALFLMEGLKNLEMALKYGCVKTIFTSVGLPKIGQDIETYKVNADIINKLSVSENPEGVVFVCENLKPKKNKADYHKIVYLDKINDPGNLGTIIRTAVAFDFDAVILSEGTVDLYNEKVIAASKGAIFATDVFYDDINEYKNNHKVIASALTNKSIPLSKASKHQDFILVLGNESHGVSQDILKQADEIIKIEMSDKIDSLNVAIAAGILMNFYK